MKKLLWGLLLVSILSVIIYASYRHYRCEMECEQQPVCIYMCLHS